MNKALLQAFILYSFVMKTHENDALQSVQAKKPQPVKVHKEL
jgi:hypothetical protein